MLRMTLLLCSAIFLTFVIGGRDQGQQREGLIPRAPIATAAAPIAAYVPPDPAPRPTIAREAEGRPVQVRAERLTASDVSPAPTQVAVPDPSQMMPVVYVNASSVNVRQGPSTQDAVIARLDRGEAALVVWSDDTGWSRIRVEGDGVEGYVATRFLTGLPADLSY